MTTPQTQANDPCSIVRTTTRNIFAALIISSALIAASPSSAQPLDNDCHYQWNVDRVLHNRPASERARFVGGALRYCQWGDQLPYLAELLDPVRKDDLGLCFYEAQSVKLERSPSGDLVEPGGLIVGVWQSSHTRMLQQNGTCPRQDDDGYIDNIHVPDDQFLSLLNFWNDIRRSPGDFDEAVVSSAAADAGGLKSWLVDPKVAKDIRLSTISAVSGLSLPENGQRAVHFELNIAIYPGGGFFIDVDRVGKAWQIVRVTDFKP